MVFFFADLIDKGLCGHNAGMGFLHAATDLFEFARVPPGADVQSLKASIRDGMYRKAQERVAFNG